jgi:hypothetical protein
MTDRLHPTPAAAIDAVRELMLPAAIPDDARLPTWAHQTMLEFLAAAQRQEPQHRTTALLHAVFFLGVAAERNGWACDYEAVQPQ